MITKKDQETLIQQSAHWEKTYSAEAEMFGTEPSEAAKKAAKTFKKEGKIRILELGGGQGRDTLFFAQSGFDVYVLDYSDAGIKEIQNKARALGVSQNITAIRHDAREPLPFDNAFFDACYSHMFFCMAFTTHELEQICGEVERVLKPGGIHIYTVRNTDDPHYGKGIHRGEDMYEVSGFIVHFFSEAKARQLAQNFNPVDVDTLEEEELPRRLYYVTSRK